MVAAAATDTIYTERYMQTPQVNGGNYTLSKVHEFDNFGSTDFLLIHGTADGTTAQRERAQRSIAAALIQNFT